MQTIMNALSFSIVINTYNRCKFLKTTLQSLSYLRYPYFEVICVNGPSTDSTAVLLDRWVPRLKVVACPEANLSLSRNMGIAAAAGDIVCFIDDDALAEPDWLDQLAFGYSSPNVAAVGGYIRNHTGVEYQSRVVICDRFADTQFFDSLEHAAQSAVFATTPESEYAIALTGTNCSFRREALVQIGGFDETYVYFLDETDVLIRLKDAGYNICCKPEAEVHHKYAPSHLRTVNNIPKSLYYPAKSKTYFAFRHALKTHSFTQVASHVYRYLNYVMSCQDFSARHNLIDQETCERLKREIGKGYADGLHQAFCAMAPSTRPASYFADSPAFNAFPVLQPAATRLKICFISKDYPPKTNGGIGIWCASLARGLAAQGHEVTVITHSENHHTVDLEDCVWVHRIPQHHMPNRPYAAFPQLPQLVYDWSASAHSEVLRVMAQRGLDVVSAPIWDVEGCVTQASGCIPTILTLHTSYALALPSKPEWREMHNYLSEHVEPIMQMEKHLLLSSPLVVANSTGVVTDMERAYQVQIPKERLRLVPHGLRDIVGEAVTRPVTYAPNNDACQFLFVGRFEQRKGTDVLLQAVPELLEAFPKACFTLVGDNSISDHRMRFEQKNATAPWMSRVVFMGRVSHAALQEAYASCDVFVAPSRYESFGLIYLEAMMYAKACIGTRVGGIPEVVMDGETGLLVDPDNVEQLLEAMKILAADAERRIRYGNRGRARYERVFSLEVMVSETVAAVRNCLHSNSKVNIGDNVACCTPATKSTFKRKIL